jgi:hypothetical protein
MTTITPLPTDAEINRSTEVSTNLQVQAYVTFAPPIEPGGPSAGEIVVTAANNPVVPCPVPDAIILIAGRDYDDGDSIVPLDRRGATKLRDDLTALLNP